MITPTDFYHWFPFFGKYRLIYGRLELSFISTVHSQAMVYILAAGIFPVREELRLLVPLYWSIFSDFTP